MAFKLIIDRDESLGAFEAARKGFATGARFYPGHYVGWQSSSGRFDVYWHPELSVWGLFQPDPPRSEGRRFWIGFGVQDPSNLPTLMFTVEANPPDRGIDRYVAGAFLRGPDGATYLAHTGRVGGGRKGIGQKAFLEFFKGGTRVYEPTRRSELILLGKIGEPDFAEDVGAFVKEVARFKETVAGGK